MRVLAKEAHIFTSWFYSSLPEVEDGALAFYNVTGRQVHEVKGRYVEGINRVTVQTNQIGASGLVYYSLIAGEFTVPKKMMIIR